MSQPRTQSQKLPPDLATEANFSRERYLPRITPSMSVSASLTREMPCAFQASIVLASSGAGWEGFGLAMGSSRRRVGGRAVPACFGILVPERDCLQANFFDGGSSNVPASLHFPKKPQRISG